ncbi:MAG: hypothetical protein M5U01_33950 [Ardenticatenaceae bacterium]|nr:hypothetical protein [Ardenticatenaceae bacterium]
MQSRVGCGGLEQRVQQAEARRQDRQAAHRLAVGQVAGDVAIGGGRPEMPALKSPVGR